MTATTTELGLSTIGQIALSVRHVDDAVTFYRDVLGMRFLFKAPPALAFFDCGGVRLMLSAPEAGEEVSGNSILYFKVPDLAQTHQTLASHGVSFVDEPHLVARMPDHELWICFFRDPEGNLMGLMEEKRSR